MFRWLFVVGLGISLAACAGRADDQAMLGVAPGRNQLVILADDDRSLPRAVLLQARTAALRAGYAMHQPGLPIDYELEISIGYSRRNVTGFTPLAGGAAAAKGSRGPASLIVPWRRTQNLVRVTAIMFAGANGKEVWRTVVAQRGPGTDHVAERAATHALASLPRYASGTGAVASKPTSRSTTRR